MTLVLIFTLGEEVYGLEIEAVQEIIEDPPLHYVPRAEGVLVGAVNFHGQVLAVIDLPTLFGLSGQKRDHRRVVLAPQFKSLVLTVSSVQKIVRIDLSTLQPPSTKTGPGAVRGVATLDELVVNMLDTQEVIKQLGNQAS
jgi:chemotaxis signal transduction protein